MDGVRVGRKLAKWDATWVVDWAGKSGSKWADTMAVFVVAQTVGR